MGGRHEAKIGEKRMWMKEGKTSGEMVCPTTVNHYDSPQIQRIH